MEKKVLVPVAQGVEEMETITIIDVLRRSGASVIAASVDE
ncbi:MAG: DJ-1/PfpI family protein, partial [Deltaproteobacteria bacterium]|nr:DJ-1/PfpI family protein [Deltaproteobacteria bacterium]